jgi:N,N'-diacetyllegionaminate synthase
MTQEHRRMSTIRIADRVLGGGAACLIAAEVGLNHNGDFDLAIELIEAAACAGADAVKFQNYSTEDFLSDRTLTYQYRSQGQLVTEPQWDMFKRCEMPAAWLPRLSAHCRQHDVLFFSTPTSPEGVGQLVEAGAAMVKNGSDCLGHLPLIRAMARSGLPTVLSTGMATLAEVDEAVRAFRHGRGRDLVVLHCTSAYPTPPEDVHLRKLPALAAALGCPVGLSDHTAGSVAAIGAVALGACFLEKHFCLSKELPGPDQWFSADPAEMTRYVNEVRALEASLGTSAIGPAKAEEAARRGYRLSCVAARDLPAGTRLSDGDIAFRRPGDGLPPAAADWLVGLALGCSVAAGHVFRSADFFNSAGAVVPGPHTRAKYRPLLEVDP